MSLVPFFSIFREAFLVVRGLVYLGNWHMVERCSDYSFELIVNE